MNRPRLVLGLVALLGAGCGRSATSDNAATPRSAVVEIPDVSEEQAGASPDEELPRADRRERTESPEAEVEPGPAEVTDSIWGSMSAGGSTGGPDCDRAADCCLKFAQNRAPDPSLIAVCDGVRRAPTSACGHYLSSFRQVAPQIGVQCN